MHGDRNESTYWRAAPSTPEAFDSPFSVRYLSSSSFFSIKMVRVLSKRVHARGNYMAIWSPSVPAISFAAGVVAGLHSRTLANCRKGKKKVRGLLGWSGGNRNHGVFGKTGGCPFAFFNLQTCAVWKYTFTRNVPCAAVQNDIQW